MERTASEAAFETSIEIATRIPTRMGLQLGATMVRPVTTERVPALVNYDPSRGAWSGEVGSEAKYFAERGYAYVYLHAPGTGNSDGVSVDEYTHEETNGGYDAIEWLAAQSWCTGAIGMLGASYSGFTALQVAALAPPSLKAIAPAYFTDRRYTDDCHYKGGCLRGYYDTLHYGLWMVGMNAMPPHPRAVGHRWAEMWRERLEQSEPYLLKWLAHPIEDEYWMRGSVIGSCHHIQAASLLIGGWHDGYPNPPLRTFRALTAPKKLLLGPWSHTYPNRSHCGPRIDIYFELLRWWDRWLKGVENGVEREPSVLVYLQEFEAPVEDRILIAGGWYAAEDLAAIDTNRTWHLGRGVLRAAPDPSPNAQTLAYLPGASLSGGIWDGGMPYCLPGDQRRDEALALNFTSEPLLEDLVLFGQPPVTLTVSADVPVLPLAVRLCEVGEDGVSVLVTKGILNLTRRKGVSTAVALTRGEPTRVELELETTAWRFGKGRRVRLSVNGSDFPNIWPTPRAGTLTVYFGSGIDASVTLPIWRAAEHAPDLLRASPDPPRSTGSGGDPPAWRITHDVLEDRLHFLMENGNEFSVSNRHPARAYAKGKSVSTASWDGFTARAEATSSLVSDEDSFHLTLTLNVWVNDTPHFQRTWCQSFERRLM